MSSSPTVVVKKGGFLTALVSGLFGTIIVVIICGSALGFYALHVADRNAGEILRGGKDLASIIPQVAESVNQVSDWLNDRRSIDYRDELDVSVRMVSRSNPRTGAFAVVDVTNNGPDLVTFLTARIEVADEDGVPISDPRAFLATPIGFNEHDWPGPLMPGASRTLRVFLGTCPPDAVADRIEITDVRIWNEEDAARSAAAKKDLLFARSPVPQPDVAVESATTETHVGDEPATESEEAKNGGGSADAAPSR